MSSLTITHHEHCTTKVSVSTECKHTGLHELRFIRVMTPDVVEHDFKLFVTSQEIADLGAFFKSQAK